VEEAIAGEYHSVFKGQGIEYEEVRPYQAGDDVRTIDWNVTSRVGSLHVKKYVEERELTVFILVDVSKSTRYGSVQKSKDEIEAEIAAVLAFSAIKNNDRVGAILFTDEVELYIAPRKGSRHVLRLVREILAFEPKGKKTSLKNALEFLLRVLKKSGVVFIISDFFDDGYESVLKVASFKYDIVALSVNDSKELTLPRGRWIYFEDWESGQIKLVPTFLSPVKDEYEERIKHFLQKRDALFRSLGIDFVNLYADSPYEKELVRFFKRRVKRVRR